MSKVKFLDLGRQPIANGFLTKEELEKDDEFFFDLSLSDWKQRRGFSEKLRHRISHMRGAVW